jgi:hypothetical protein
MAVAPSSAIAIIASMKGAPSIAPTPTSSAAAWSPPPNTTDKIAMTGNMVSGRAVRTAASRLPVALSLIPSEWPSHSTALVKLRTQQQHRERENQQTEISEWMHRCHQGHGALY